MIRVQIKLNIKKKIDESFNTPLKSLVARLQLCCSQKKILKKTV